MNKAVDFANVRNVLVLRTDHLGDLLLSTPLIRAMRKALPARRFVLVASPSNSEVLAGWDALDEVRVFDPNWSWYQKWQFVRQLRQTRWDLCLTLSPRTRSYVLGRLSNAPVRAGIIYSRRILARLLSTVWLTHAFVSSVDERLDLGKSVPHEVIQLSVIAGLLGLKSNEPGPLEIPLEQSALVWAREWLTKNKLVTDAEPSAPEPCLIGIHGADKWLSQGWTAADFMSLVRSVAESRAESNILLTFGPGDGPLQTATAEILKEAPIQAVLCPGQLPVSRWAALLSLCDAVITPDTGSLHLAVALGRPVVALYESDTFLHCSSQWAPWQVPNAIVRRGTPATTVPLIVGETLRLLSSGRNA